MPKEQTRTLPSHRALGTLMLHTSLSNEACRRHLRDGTKPTNVTLRESWDEAIKEIKRGKL